MPLNYQNVQSHVNAELVQDFDVGLFSRWQEVVRGWLQRDFVNNNLIVSGSVTPSANPFELDSGNIESVIELYYQNNGRDYYLSPAPKDKIREWKGVSGADPAWYTVTTDGKVEVSPWTAQTYYYTALAYDSAMVGPTDSSQALQDAPGMVLAAFKWCAYGHQHDREGQAVEKQNYIDELLAYREHEAMKLGAEAPDSSGAWTWV